MNIEIGKQYKNEQGERATLVHILSKPTQRNYTLILQQEDGRLWIDQNPPRLFTAEVGQYDNWPIDTPILVSENGKNWFKRHFSGVTNSGLPTAFACGLTSWSNNESITIPWKYAKLPEGDK